MIAVKDSKIPFRMMVTKYMMKKTAPALGLLLILIPMLVLSGCGIWPITRRIDPPPGVDEVEGVKKVGVDPAPEYDYRLGVGDSFLVRFFFYPDMLEPSIKVPSTGVVQMPLIGPTQVIGLTEEELNSMLREEYAKRLMYPDVVARITSRQHGDVSLDGAVTGRGTIAYNSQLTLLDVLKRGGMAKNGVLRSIIVIRGLNTPQFTTFRVNGKKVLTGKAHDIYLQPGDIVYVPSKFISDVNYFVSAYIDGVLGRHIAPAQIFPQPFPFRGDVNYDLSIGVQTP